MSIQAKILLSRFLTRFGDQAWDFAVPLTLIFIFPGQIQLIAFVYLISKLTQIVVGPWFIKKIDSRKRLDIFKLGIGLQTIALILMWAILFFQNAHLASYGELSTLDKFFSFLALALFGAASNIGSSLMDVSVGFDLAVDIIPENELTVFNSRLKRLDLVTEVSAPLVAGLIISLLNKQQSILGFTLIALLNIATFIPEYLLLSSIQQLKEYREKIMTTEIKKNFLSEFIDSLKKLKGKSYAIVIVSYALLWFSVLSPHGVLLTSYLKDGAKASELTIGFFRGAGALFGLIPTYIFANLKNRFGLLLTSRYLLFFQFIMVLMAALSFFYLDGISFFLIFILFSRIGLYGFSIGETELRQLMIPKDKRGEVNGIANSITGMATVGLFLMGSLIGETANFGMMIIISTLAVLLAVIVFSFLEKESHH